MSDHFATAIMRPAGMGRDEWSHRRKAIVEALAKARLKPSIRYDASKRPADAKRAAEAYRERMRKALAKAGLEANIVVSEGFSLSLDEVFGARR